MIKLGVNSVLFKGVTFREAAEIIKKCGYDGVEISAIQGMCEHFNLDGGKDHFDELKAISAEYELPFLSTEVASLDYDRLMKAYEACAYVGVPIVNVGPGGISDDPVTTEASMKQIAKMAGEAEKFGVTLCCKAHVNAAIYNTPTTLALTEYVKSPAFGVDMDPSHIYRAGEYPEIALGDVISKVKHVHIRDCVGRGPSPGEPLKQICGVGEIDLQGYFKAMVNGSYDGPVCLEIIGPEMSPIDATIIAAESYGYMNAVLKALGAR